MAICSFGGPLALAALNAPTLLGDAGSSAGLVMVAGLAVFTVLLVIWFRYSRYVNGSGGLYGFVEAAAGRKVALLQAAAWIVSYALYLVYTTVQIVYDVLPVAVPGVRHYQTLLTLLIPIAVAVVMVAGRGATLIVLGLMAIGQLVLAGILDGLALTHLSTPASSFGSAAGAGAIAKAGAQTSLLYVCGSLPLFLGGELRSPGRTIRRGVSASYLITGLVVVLAVAPLAAAPGLSRTAVPGVSLAQQFASPGVAEAIGIGVAVSITGVILCEFVALTRLVHAIGGWPVGRVTTIVAGLMVLIAPLALIDPGGFYDTLLKPSLVALWISQLIVFLVYPRFAGKHRLRALPAWILSFVASGLAIYGLWTALQGSGS